MLALFSHPPVAMTKQFDTNGNKIADYPSDTFWWGAQQVLVNNIDELAIAVRHYSKIDNSIILRGGLSASGANKIDNNKLITRRKFQYTNTTPDIIETSLSWAMLDIDKALLRECDDLVCDPEIAIEHAIYSTLPEAFHDVSCFWQFSSSAGFVPNVLKVHLWYMLDKPMDNLTLRRLLVPYVDVAPFNACQPHYVVPPVCVRDPLPRRMGMLSLGTDFVTVSNIPVKTFEYLPPSFGGVSTGDYVKDFESTIAMLGDGLLGFHAPLRDAAHFYNLAVATKQLVRDDDNFKEYLRAAIDAAPKSSGRDRKVIEHYLSDRYLEEIIASSQRKLLSDPCHQVVTRFRSYRFSDKTIRDFDM